MSLKYEPGGFGLKTMSLKYEYLSSGGFGLNTMSLKNEPSSEPGSLLGTGGGVLLRAAGRRRPLLLFVSQVYKP